MVLATQKAIENRVAEIFRRPLKSIERMRRLGATHHLKNSGGRLKSRIARFSDGLFRAGSARQLLPVLLFDDVVHALSAAFGAVFVVGFVAVFDAVFPLYGAIHHHFAFFVENGPAVAVEADNFEAVRPALRVVVLLAFECAVVVKLYMPSNWFCALRPISWVKALFR